MMCFGLKDRKRLKNSHCVIVLLDDTQLVHELHPTTSGQDLLDVVFKHLNLLETSYFGLKYYARERRQSDDEALARDQEACWLDTASSAVKQLRGSLPMTVYFGVKHYAADPCKLAEEITRYQFFLQCKQDILHARLPISFELAVELFGLAIQSELGDFDSARHLAGYASEFRFAPQQSAELEHGAAMCHRRLVGQVPAAAELNFLERVKWLDLYGCQLYPIQYDEGALGDQYALGLAPTGVLVLRNKCRVAQYAWTRIVKTKCQGRCFLMDVIDAGQQPAVAQQQAQQAVTGKRNRFGFRLADKRASRQLRQALEQHRSFYLLVGAAASRRAQLEAAALQLRPKFGQRFRQSIRSAMSAGAHLSPAFYQQQQQQYAALAQHEQRLRASVKSLQQQQQQQQQARAPPAVVRTPSRRYGQSMRSLQRPSAYERQALVAHGLPAPPALPPPPAPHASGAHTMVESQRKQALLMMQQMQQQQQQQQQSSLLALTQQYSNRSQTLRPQTAKDRRSLHYQQQMFMAAALAQQQQQQQQPGAPLPEISIVPPGQHIVQPSIYRASSVLDGVNQLGAGQDLLVRQRAGAPALRARAGHESPRSTKSAVAPSSALKIAGKQLAEQQHKQRLYYSGLCADESLLGAQSASASPRIERRLAGQRSKSTCEDLHLIARKSNRALLAAVAPPGLPPPDYNSSTPQRHRHHATDHEAARRFLAPSAGDQVKQAPDRRRAPAKHQGRRRASDDDDYYCSRSDCSSVDDAGKHRRARANELASLAPLERTSVARDWNAIKRRHNEFSNGKGLLGQLDARNLSTSIGAGQHQNNGLPLDANNNNNSSSGGATNVSNLVKNIANKQATPILLSMSHHFNPANERHQNEQRQQLLVGSDNSKAVQLLNMQRQQLNSASSDGANSTTTTTTTSGKGQSNSSNSPTSSLPSSPRASAAEAKQQQQPHVKSSTHQAQRNHHHQPEGSTVSNNSTTSGYYADSNSTGLASADSDTIDSQMLGLNFGCPNNASAQIGNRPAARQPTQQFYFGGGKPTDFEDDNNSQHDPKLQSNAKVNHQQQQQGRWSPLEQLQQHAPSSLKYVSFDV